MFNFNEVPGGSFETKEQESKIETKVIMHFMRHEEKGKAAEGQTDDVVELTAKGKANASGRGRLEKPQGAALAFGSPRVRARDTGMRRAYAGYMDFDENQSFEESKKMLDQDFKIGTRIGTLTELNFNAVPGEYDKRFRQSFNEGHLMEYLINQSDQDMIDLKDKESLSYSRVAANIASLVGREMQVGNTFNRLASEDPKKYRDFHNQLERFMGTHNSVSECFYLKVLEKTQGREAAEKFINLLQDEKGGHGFNFQEGYKVEIVNGPDGQKVMLQGIYGFPDTEITPELLREIIADAVNLDRKIEGKE